MRESAIIRIIAYMHLSMINAKINNIAFHNCNYSNECELATAHSGAGLSIVSSRSAGTIHARHAGNVNFRVRSVQTDGLRRGSYSIGSALPRRLMPLHPAPRQLYHSSKGFLRMRIIGLAGWSGAGKTTLLAKALPRIAARGLTVSTLKHAHHSFDLDQPGKDSHTRRMAGATEVLIASANRYAPMHELRGARPCRPAPIPCSCRRTVASRATWCCCRPASTGRRYSPRPHELIKKSHFLNESNNGRSARAARPCICAQGGRYRTAETLAAWLTT
jgi:hypothetical protein